ncbi:IST1-like protein [Tanacetum coccineum]
MSLGKILPPWHQFLDQKIRGAHFSLGIVAGERFAIELTPSTFPQRHFAGDMFPQRHVAGEGGGGGEKVGMLLGKASNVVVSRHQGSVAEYVKLKSITASDQSKLRRRLLSLFNVKDLYQQLCLSSCLDGAKPPSGTISSRKKAIEKAHCRLNELKTKRCWIVNHLRNDMEKLIKLGESETAFERADQVYKDEGMIVVYELLALFCEHISFHLSRIRRKKNCPKEVMEAVSSLMFASARCKDLPELLHIRRLFTSRYGKSLETKALSGNRVNIQIIEKLSIEKVSNEVKCKLLKEISDLNQRGFLFVSSPLSGHEKTMERGMSMPCKRSATMPLDDKSLKKSYSLPPAYAPPHIHPKLPDYEFFFRSLIRFVGSLWGHLNLDGHRIMGIRPLWTLNLFGTWHKQFEARMTRNYDFYLLNVEKVSVPFMTLNEKRFEYGSFNAYRMIKLPYKSNGRSKYTFSMHILLPDRIDGLRDLIEVFHADNTLFHGDFDLKMETLCHLWIPKFKISSSFEQEDVMQKTEIN